MVFPSFKYWGANPPEKVCLLKGLWEGHKNAGRKGQNNLRTRSGRASVPLRKNFKTLAITGGTDRGSGLGGSGSCIGGFSESPTGEPDPRFNGHPPLRGGDPFVGHRSCCGRGGGTRRDRVRHPCKTTTATNSKTKKHPVPPELS